MSENDINNPKLDEQAPDDGAATSDTTENVEPVKVDLLELPPPPTENAGFDVSNLEAVKGELTPNSEIERTPTGRIKRTTEQKAETKRKKESKSAELEKLLLAGSSADTIVDGLDMLKNLLSNGESVIDPEARKRVLATWTEYCRKTGKSIPIEILVFYSSVAYVAPALNTEGGKSLLMGAWIKARGLWGRVRG